MFVPKTMSIKLFFSLDRIEMSPARSSWCRTTEPSNLQSSFQPEVTSCSSSAVSSQPSSLYAENSNLRSSNGLSNNNNSSSNNNSNSCLCNINNFLFRIRTIQFWVSAQEEFCRCHWLGKRR
jgi:hypothetical protein